MLVLDKVERCQSGRMGSPGTRVGGQPSPGFESLSLRHLNLLYVFEVVQRVKF